MDLVMRLLLLSTLTSTTLAYAQGPAGSRYLYEDNPYRERAKEILENLDEQRKQGEAFWKDHKPMSGLTQATGIANQELQNSRESVLNYLGLSDTMPRTYIFVSLSMPESLIKAYLREAMWTGSIVVIRGIKEGSTLGEFVREDMIKYISDKGATATIQIDPRLFDVFEITHVPALVYTNLQSKDLCQFEKPPKMGIPSTSVRCPPADPTTYYKLTGGVTLRWALEQFVEAGAPEADKLLGSLNYNLPEATNQLQEGFSGDWDDLPTPGQKSALYDALRDLGSVYQTKDGRISVGPAGLEQYEGIDLVE